MEGRIVSARTLNQAGFTLLEVMVALFLIALGVLAAAPMFVYAMQGNAVGGDLGTVGAVAVERMELLRSQAYTALPAGGSLTSGVTGYNDTTNPDAIVRWQITDNVTPVGTKTIQVRAVARRRAVGRAKEVTLTSVRGR